MRLCQTSRKWAHGHFLASVDDKDWGSLKFLRDLVFPKNAVKIKRARLVEKSLELCKIASGRLRYLWLKMSLRWRAKTPPLMERCGNIEGEVIAPIGARDSDNHYRAPRHSGEGALQPLSARVCRPSLCANKRDGRMNTHGSGIHPDAKELRHLWARTYLPLANTGADRSWVLRARYPSPVAGNCEPGAHGYSIFGRDILGQNAAKLYQPGR